MDYTFVRKIEREEDFEVSGLEEDIVKRTRYYEGMSEDPPVGYYPPNAERGASSTLFAEVLIFTRHFRW